MDKYTTAKLVTADKEGIEVSKTVISDDAFAIVDLIDKLINKIEQTRSSLM